MGAVFIGRYIFVSRGLLHLLTSCIQLAEAILTEQAPPVESIAIRLADTRSPLRTVQDHERVFLVSGRDSDEEDDNDDDEAKHEERNRILTHSSALISRIDLEELDRYEVPHSDDSRPSWEGTRPRVSSGRHGGDTLSSKAGIILVGTIRSLSFSFGLTMSIRSTGYS